MNYTPIRIRDRKIFLAGSVIDLALVLPYFYGMKTATKGAIRNFHLPLPQRVYEALRAEAAALHQPATAVAREAIEAWLRERKRAAVREDIATYALKHAGTAADLDPSLESAALELLRGKKPRR
jgi:hypothetical protein